MADNTVPSEVVFRVRRFDPTTDAEPHFEDYRIPNPPGMITKAVECLTNWNLRTKK